MGTDFASDNPNVKSEWKRGHVALRQVEEPIEVPQGIIERIPQDKMDALSYYRTAKEMGSADIVLCTTNRSGISYAVLIKRLNTEPFGGKWWVIGGTVGAYQDILEYIAERTDKECGIAVRPEVLLGFYRTSAPDKPQSSLQICFAARVPYELLRVKLRPDQNHSDARLFAIDTLESMPPEGRHWYPRHVATLALLNMP